MPRVKITKLTRKIIFYIRKRGLKIYVRKSLDDSTIAENVMKMEIIILKE